MKYTLIPSTLLVAAALSTPAFATDYTLTDGSVNLADDNGSTTWAGDTFTISSSILNTDNWGTDGYKGAWIGWGTQGSSTSLAVGTSTDKVTITGSGFFGIAFAQANGNTTVDLTNVVVSNFSGQICVVNQWNGSATVALSGDQWKNVEYVFGSVTAEWAGVTTGDTGAWKGNKTFPGLFTRGTAGANDSSHEHDTLALQGDTMLAGITGTSKDYTVGSNNFANEDSITVTTAGTKLTIAGAGEYAFYGTVGASGTEASLAMTGTGSQTFGGTNYLKDVTVASGTLALDGTTSIAGSVSLTTDGTLTLGGEITLSSAISNSGAVSIADGTSFVLDNLTAIYDATTGREYYELIISPGTGSLTINNLTSLGFILDGETINWTAYKTDGGYLYVYSDTLATKNLIWSGTSGTNTWTTDGSVTDWTIANTTTSAAFASGDNVTFGPNTEGSLSTAIVLGEDITAGTVNITGSGYTLTAGSGSTLTATEIVLDDEESGDTHTFTIAQGVTVEAESLTESAGQLDLVVNGTLNVSGMTISSEDSESISGSGTLKVGNLTHSSLQGHSLTISVAQAEFTNIYMSNHSNYGSSDSNNTDGYHTIVIGDVDADHTTTAVVTGTLSFGGASAIEVTAGSKLTVGTLTDTGGYKTSISGDGTLIVEGSMTFAGNSGNTVIISIANLQAGSITVNNNNESNNGSAITISSTNFTVGTFTHNSYGSLTISSANFKADSLMLTGGYNNSNTVSITFADGANAVIGAIESTMTHNLTVEEGATLTAGYIYRSGNTLNLAVNGELYVEKDLNGYSDSTGMLSFGKLNDGGTGMEQTLSGTGTANVYGIEASLGSGSLTISVANLNIGEGGIAKSGNGTLTIDGTTIGLYNTTASEISAAVTIGSNGAGFTPGSGETLTISGVLSGSGAISMTGEGSLTLSGANTFSGGTIINAGKVVAADSSALGSGDVTIKNGGQLEISKDVTISNNINIVLSTENMSSVSTTSVVTAYASDSYIYAIIGSGSITGDDVKITITIDDEVAELLRSSAEGTTYTFYIYEGISLGNNVTIDYSALSQYGVTQNGDGTITLMPEPELFSIFFGLGALGLVATRRRRRKVA